MFISILLICIAIGAFFLIKAFNQPNDIALSDPFTSQFIDTGVETDEGFHYFESGNGKFSMWFPEVFSLEEQAPLYISKDHYTLLNLFNRPHDEEGLKKSITMRHITNVDQEQAHIRFENVLEDIGYNGSYEEEENEFSTVLKGRSFITVENKETISGDPNENSANRYFAVVINNKYNEFLEMTYRIDCSKGYSCSIQSKKEYDFFDSLISEVVFSNR